MNNESTGCFICGQKNNKVLQEHHIVPRRHDGTDKQSNLVSLCANCHQAIEKIYDKEFYKKLGVLDKENTEQFDGFDSVPTIYLAGVMDWDGEPGCEDSHWRASITDSNLSGKYNILTPYDAYFDHGGCRVENVVESDIDLINQSDCVLAYIKREDQIGTITEIFHAINEKMPVLVIFEGYVQCQDQNGDPRYGGVAPNFTDEENKVTIRGSSPHYWFLWNYLVEKGKTSDFITVKAGTEVDVKSLAEKWLDDLGAHYWLYRHGITDNLQETNEVKK